MRAYLKICEQGGAVRFFDPYRRKLTFHRFFGLRPSEWLTWLRSASWLSSEVLPQDVEWIEENDQNCLRISFAEPEHAVTMTLWHSDIGELTGLCDVLRGPSR